MLSRWALYSLSCILIPAFWVCWMELSWQSACVVYTEPWVWSSAWNKMHTCNPSTSEVGAGGPVICGYIVNLGPDWTCLRRLGVGSGGRKGKKGTQEAERQVNLYQFILICNIFTFRPTRDTKWDLVWKEKKKGRNQEVKKKKWSLVVETRPLDVLFLEEWTTSHGMPVRALKFLIIKEQEQRGGDGSWIRAFVLFRGLPLLVSTHT